MAGRLYSQLLSLEDLLLGGELTLTGAQAGGGGSSGRRVVCIRLSVLGYRRGADVHPVTAVATGVTHPAHPTHPTRPTDDRRGAGGGGGAG